MKKILIVEDELDFSRLLHDQLTAKGYKAIVAEDGEKGLAMAKKVKPDLILLDLLMPKMNGMTMLKLLREDAGIKNTKVILLTVLSQDEKIRTQLAGDKLTHYGLKGDIELSELLEKIKALV